MLCGVYLRRRLVMLGLVLWITTLLFAYAFLAQETELNDARARGKRVLQIEENLDYVERFNQNDGTADKIEQALKPLEYFSLSRYTGGLEGTLRDQPSISEYCNRESSMSRSQEGDVSPSNYDLLSVHIITRHGDRAPMYSFSHHPNQRQSCKFDPEEVKDNIRLADFLETMKASEGGQKPFSGFQGWALYPNREKCDTSQLTPVGAKQMLNLGTLMRERYLQRWRLLPGDVTPDEISIRSTEYSRTYQSAVSFLYAFLPNFNLTRFSIHRSASYFFCSEQTVSGPCLCPVLTELKKQSDRVAGSLIRNTTNYQSLMSTLSEIYEMAKNRLPGLWSMTDVFLTHACNSLPFPCNTKGQCVKSDMVTELWTHVANYTKHLTQIFKYRQYASLSLHPLLSEITENMQSVIKGESKVKVNIFSGHDGTIIPLNVVFGVPITHWPRFASRFVMELYSRRNTKQHFIRMLYNGNDVTGHVVFCRGFLSDNMCPLDRFIHFVFNKNLEIFHDNEYINVCYSPA